LVEFVAAAWLISPIAMQHGIHVPSTSYPSSRDGGGRRRAREPNASEFCEIGVGEYRSLELASLVFNSRGDIKSLPSGITSVLPQSIPGSSALSETGP